MSLDLLYVRSLFRPVDFGGNRYPWEVTRRLAARGHRIRVVTPRPRGPLPGPTAAEMRWYPASRCTPLETFVTNAVSSRLAVQRECWRARPQLVVLSSYEVAFGHFALGGGRSLPSVYIYHSRFLSDAVERLRESRGPISVVGRLVHGFTEHVERIALASPNAVIAVSPFSAEEIERRVGRRDGLELVTTGVDVELFRPGDRGAARRALGVDPSDVLLVTVGRLAPVKRYDRAIDALARLRRSDSRYRLHLIGDGPELGALRDHAVAAGVADAVRFEGFLDGDDLRTRLWAADLQLCTSDFENWSLALLEGLASGCPVIGVPTGGIPQLLGPVDPRLIAREATPTAVAEAVHGVLSEPGAREEIAARGARLVRERYGWDAVIDRLETVFRRYATS